MQHAMQCALHQNARGTRGREECVAVTYLKTVRQVQSHHARLWAVRVAGGLCYHRCAIECHLHVVPGVIGHVGFNHTHVDLRGQRYLDATHAGLRTAAASCERCGCCFKPSILAAGVPCMLAPRKRSRGAYCDVVPTLEPEPLGLFCRRPTDPTAESGQPGNPTRLHSNARCPPCTADRTGLSHITRCRHKP